MHPLHPVGGSKVRGTGAVGMGTVSEVFGVFVIGGGGCVGLFAVVA